MMFVQFFEAISDASLRENILWMGGIFLYAGTGEGLQLSPDCF